MREIVLDTETTGLDPGKGDRLVEIGAVEIVNQIPTGRTFHVLLNPERDVPEEAYRIHGHSTVSLKYKPVFAEIAAELIAFIGADRLVIHNADFDMKFINAELLRAGRELISLDRVTDTLALARRKHPGAANNLDALSERYRIDNSGRTKHGALLDARILVDVYAELTGGRQKSFTLSIEPTGNRPVATLASTLKKRVIGERARLSTAETIVHLEYVVTLGETAIWLRYEG